jgi:hypothetical protein
MILEELMEYDLAPHKHSEYAEQRPNKLVLFDTHQIEHGWVKFAQTAHTSILAARLTCSMLYNASHKSFARLIGDRIFRYTKLNTEDLARIGQKSTLSSCITTLTIGTGVFYPPNKMNRVIAALSELSAPDRGRLLQAYIDRSSWQYHMLPELQEKLISLLSALPNLSTICIVSDDFPDNLDGWIQPGDEELLRPILDPSILAYHNGPSIIRRKFYRTGIIAPTRIITAVTTAGLALEHLFISSDYFTGIPKDFSFPCHALRTLRLELPYISINQPSTTPEMRTPKRSYSTCLQTRQISRT